MRALNTKVIRDLLHLRGQVVAVGLVIASGVAVLIMSLSTLEALQETTDAYYDRYRLAHVFAGVKRAPDRLADRIAELPGVQTVQTRVVKYASLDVPGFSEPVTGQFVSLPEQGEPLLNKLALRTGRLIEPGRHDEVVLNEPFAQAHGLLPGDTLIGVLNGTRRTLQVVGIALSPEFIYSLGPGALMPDDERFGVIWVSRDALAAAFDLQESFNSVTLELNRGINPEFVIPRLDAILERFGGIGAIARADQLSNWFVMNEMDQLATISKILPTIFLVISAFLTNMVLARLIATERPQIGLMKAFGYSNLEVGLHYTKLVLGIALVGIVIGTAVGGWFGRINTQMYADLFRFPLLLYQPSASAVAIASGLSLLAAVAGAMGTVRRATSLPPAQAMQPPAPPAFQRGRLTRSGPGRWLDQPTRIIIRNIARSPGRSALTATGIASSVGLLVLALQWNDSLDYLARSYFFDAQRQHVMVGLADAQSTTVLREFEHMPGVLAVEPMRITSAELSVGPITHRGALSGVADQARLQPIYDDIRHAAVPPPADGLVLGTVLAEKLGVGVGDQVWVKLLEGRRPVLQLPVVDLVETYIAMPAYVHINVLNRLLKERPSVEFISLLVDRSEETRLFGKLKELPIVAAVMLRQAAIDSFYDNVVEHLMVFITMFSALACVLGFGVTYNSARIALSERGRELATLRVLGFSRGETSYILLGEVALLIVIALPIGCLIGRLLSELMAAAFNTELFRVPLTIEPSTYGVAVIIALSATIVSAAIVRRRVDKLDLIEVLKTRE
ncbi:MAG: ABC transporter permease [Gammaproteobacteria bacterium]|nr:ABC transporter permease [Gammaproteobacteria bacterium]